MGSLGLSLLWYSIAYIVVTCIGMLHTVFNIVVLHMKSMKDSPGMGEAYERTKPWHPLYNIIIFPICAWLYFLNVGEVDFTLAVWTGLFWGTLTLVLDLVGWVLIKHPWSLSFREFYIDYQPWISLIYLAIYVSPVIGYGLWMWG